MLTSEELTELKYQEILEYQEILPYVAIDSVITSASYAQLGCLVTAIITSLIMSCCALIFMPSPKHKNQR